jgi:hypothetical protein
MAVILAGVVLITLAKARATPAPAVQATPPAAAPALCERAPENEPVA